jgi:hypothetical protein
MTADGRPDGDVVGHCPQAQEGAAPDVLELDEEPPPDAPDFEPVDEPVEEVPEESVFGVLEDPPSPAVAGADVLPDDPARLSVR